jgi:hypothetical protein
MGAFDENDQLRAGVLPSDPEQDAVSMDRLDVDGWGAPMLFHDAVVPPFTVDVLPGWMATWCVEQATAIQVPHDLPALLAEELIELDARIRTSRAAPGAIQLEAKRMEAEAKKRLSALREALDRNPKEASAVISAAFEGKLTATPIETPDGPRFQIEGTACLGRMLALESDPEGVNKNPPEKFASPGGPEPLWNPPAEGQTVQVPMYLRAC